MDHVSALCAKDCKKPRCSACFLARNLKQLREQFPWLEVRSSPTFGVGCMDCRVAGKTKKACHGGSWACFGIVAHSSLQVRSLERHQESECHVLASGENYNNEHDDRAPGINDFKTLLNHVKRTTVGRDGVGSVGGHKKCRKMMWCLAEANRERKRAHFRKGKGVDSNDVLISTTIYQDARKGKLQVRCTSASSGLEKFDGHLGTVDLAKHFSLDACGIMQGTLFALESFCIRWCGPPYVDDDSKVPQPEMDVELRNALIQSVETYVSDSASDEIRAGHMLAGQSTSSQYLPSLPSLKVVVRDKPHATRRNLSRGWAADPVLDDVIKRFVLGERSPTRLIQFSQRFKNLFASNIHALEQSLSVVKAHEFLKDLGFAPHRFESLQKPLSRIVLFFHPFLATLTQIAHERKGSEEGQAALSFLQWLTVERCLLAGMMADAGEENLCLTRMVDYQGFPLAELPSNIIAFKERLRHLFTGSDPLCLRTGFTKHMLDVLGHEYALNLPGEFKLLSSSTGASQDVIDKALSHMSAWVCLTEATLSAEFPAFEIQSAFSIFSVTGDLQKTNSEIRRCKEMSRLQQAFGCRDDPAALKQLEHLRFIAGRFSLEENLNSCQAWLHAMQSVTRSWNKPDFAELLPILVRFFAAGASSSGVEQAFSQAAKLMELLQIDTHVGDAMEAQCL